MVRKVTFILFLIALLVAFFYFRPLFLKHEPRPFLLDRMPAGDFLGKVSLLDLARESSPLLYYHKIPFRDLFSPEFLLAQAKSYGVDIQKPSYFFANETGEWGTLIHVSDSSKLISGVVRLKKNMKVKDTIVGNQKVFILNASRTFVTYGLNWLFIYKGDQLPKRMYHVIYSKRGDTNISWKAFKREKQFYRNKVVLYANNERIRSKGFTTVILSHESDSTDITFKAYVRTDSLLKIKPKNQGIEFLNTSGSTGKLINAHFDIRKLRGSSNDPYYKVLKSVSRRVSFPLNSFLNTWEGDLSFHQGGTIKVKEKYIETVMDENFMSTEVVKEKDKEVPAFALLFSINENIHDLLYQLFVKGILRRDGDKLHFLFSPAIKMKLTPNVIYFYSSDNVPQTSESSHIGGIWTHAGTKFSFQLDSMNQRESFGSVKIPVKGILKFTKILKF